MAALPSRFPNAGSVAPSDWCGNCVDNPAAAVIPRKWRRSNGQSIVRPPDLSSNHVRSQRCDHSHGLPGIYLPL